MALNWTQQPLSPIDVTVGPCAWTASMLAGEHRDYVRAHPSLVVVRPQDSDETLQAAAAALQDLPVMLVIAEPSFARRLPQRIESRLELIGRDRVEIVAMQVDEVEDLKSGGMLQTLFQMRENDRADHVGLCHDDPRAIEWLAGNTACRVLGVSYSLTDQAVAYRALDQAAAFGMAAVAMHCPADDAESLQFALAQRNRVLPLMDRPLPADVTPMTEPQVEAAWRRFEQDSSAPEPLARSRPPASSG